MIFTKKIYMMKPKFLLALIFSAFISVCNGQQTTTWDKWSWLIGKWQGAGTGQPGQGGGVFSFSFDLDRNIIIRKGHSEYAGIQGRPTTIHDDLMIIYTDQKSEPGKAIYFDNEGHTINYTIVYKEKSIVFTSDKTPDAPVYRLIYDLLDNGIVNTKFEMSQDGVNFKTYVEGKSKKVNAGN
jgi:hypothetical protein